MCMPVYVSNSKFGKNSKFRMRCTCVEKYCASAENFWIC